MQVNRDQQLKLSGTEEIGEQKLSKQDERVCSSWLRALQKLAIAGQDQAQAEDAAGLESRDEGVIFAYLT